MNCKYCDAQIPEDSVVCPVCGKELEAVEEISAEETVLTETEEVEVTELTETEEVVELTEGEETEELTEAAETEEAAPAPKKKTRKIVAAIVAIVLVAATLLGVVVSGLAKPAQTVNIPSDGDPSSPMCKASYTVSDKKAIRAADQVVATMNGKTLTNGQLQAYYWQEIYMFMQENSMYAQYLGLDLSLPLDQQLFEMGEVSMSWQQFFLDGAIGTWKEYQAMALEAEAANFQMPAVRQAELDAMAADMQASAEYSGFATADELVQANVGANCSLESYMHYVRTYYQGMSYLYGYCEALEYTDAELEAYYAENEDYFVENGITKDAKFVNIRHVLLQPEGGEYGEGGYPVYTEEAWEACRQEAEQIYADWQKGDLSEESFVELAMTYSQDGNAAEGGIYEDVYEGMMVPAFNDWCFDETREVGDHGLVKTEYGYHIMFFCGTRDWKFYAEDGLINSEAYDLVPAVVGKYTADVNFKKIQLCDIKFY